MFITWGIYSAMEGYWNGVETKGIGEWIQFRERIPLKHYKKYAEKLSLDKFNAAEYAQLAKRAGMKYVVVTAKHHDGFAMWDSMASDYNIVKMGPGGRDPLRELADAVRAEGLSMCFYYSQAHDWEDPDATGNDWDFDPAQKDFARFIEGKCKAQLRELLTEYGPVGLIWFDVPQGISPEQSLDLKQFVKSFQPYCLVSGRVGHGVGDYGSLGDNQLPAGSLQGDWETPATLNNTWGYKRDDHNWKTPESLIQLLVELVSKGANYLLNIGPRADGSIPERSVTILEEVGRWMEVNGEAVYGTSASPFPTDFEWGRAAVKGNALYLYIINWQPKLELAGLRNHVCGATLLSAPDRHLDVNQTHVAEQDAHRVGIALGDSPPGQHVNVLRLGLEGGPDVNPLPCQQPDGSICLPACLVELHVAANPGVETDSAGGDAAIAAERFNLAAAKTMEVDVSGVVQNWFDTRSHIAWEFAVDTPGDYQLELRTFARKYEPWVGGHQVRVACNGQVVESRLRADTEPDTASRQYFNETGSILGILHLRAAGRHRLDLKAVAINPEDPVGLAVSMLILRKTTDEHAL
jgi:alpha-L-fucosidase